MLIDTFIFHSYIYPVYLECRAGGVDISNPVAGDETEFSLWLLGRETSYTLDRNYGWVKCNKNFNSYYVTEYDDAVFNEFQILLAQDKDVTIIHKII